MENSSAPGRIDPRSSSHHLWDWRAALLTLALVEISSRRLVITEWTPFLYFTQTMGLIGVILGLALGYSNFSRQTVMRLSAGYTLMLIPAQLLSATERTDWLWLDTVSLVSRLFSSLDLFIKSQPVNDPLFFISIVTLIYWLIGLFAGYWITRHQSFLAVVLPSGLAILTVQAFDSAQSKHIWEFGFFIFASLLLLGRIYFLQNHSFWKQTHFLLSDDAMNDLERGTLVITAIVVFISWSLPGWISDIKPAARAWREFSQPIFDKYSNAVSALDSPYADKNAGGDFYGDALALGQQAAAGNTPVFTVDVKDNTFVPVRNYWKGRVYDLYLNGQWKTTSNASIFFLPTTDELTLEYPNTRHQMEYTFTSSVKKQNLLYTPAETIWVSARVNILSTPISAELKDVNAWVATTSLSSGDKYRVRALIADPSIKELRSTVTEYPAWITDRYLQVPEDIAPQLNKLAMEITAPYDTVYDKVQAVTSYLRKEIKYETKIAAPPPENLDPVLWVLFDTKKGFCMYYASAETLMLRSIGIPTRMAVGFVEGNYDELNWQYVVTYKDAHAWPEVYFPNIGWVEFEPTSSQFPLERPETKNTNVAETIPAPTVTENSNVNPQAPVPLQEQTELTADKNSSTADQTKLYVYALIVALMVLALGIGIFHRYSFNNRLPVYLASQYERHGNAPPRWLNRWVRWTNLSPIERAFQAINLSLFWLGHPQPAHITSQKRAEFLIEYLPAEQGQILLLLQEYHTEIYTPHAGNTATARKAAAILLLKTWKIRLKRNLTISR
jgi:transglutaminase-like putative cysteine protease